MTKAILRIVTGFVVVVALLAAYWHFTHGATRFDPTIWGNGEHAEFTSDAPRLRMADGLVASGVLIGKSRPHIEQMLGRATNTEKFRNFDLVYLLGAERSFFSIDSEWLVIRFSPTGIVT